MTELQETPGRPLKWGWEEGGKAGKGEEGGGLQVIPLRTTGHVGKQS